MTAQVLQFVQLPDRDREQIRSVSDLREGDKVEVRLRRKRRANRTIPLGPSGRGNGMQIGGELKRQRAGLGGRIAASITEAPATRAVTALDQPPFPLDLSASYVYLYDETVEMAMAAPAYKGSVTTTGSSEAIRFDKSLFRQNPEFAQKAKVEAHVIGRGMLLVQVLDDERRDSDEDDPMVAAFLAFLERDAIDNPHNISPLTQEQMDRSRRLTKGIQVSDDDAIPDDVTF